MPKPPTTGENLAFGARLAALMAESGHDRHGVGAYLSRRYKVSVTTANAWLNGEHRPRLSKVRQIAADHNADYETLYFGDSSSLPSSRRGESVADFDDAKGRHKGYIRFHLMDGTVAAGHAGYAPDHPEIVRYVDVAESWAAQNLRVPNQYIRLITAQGDSMSGDIESGDVLFVDTSVQDFRADAIYVMNWHGRPMVKRLQLRRDGTLLIVSTNSAYASEIVQPDEFDQLHITGRVMASWSLHTF